MKSQNVLNTNQVKWYENGVTRLNYQMIFNEPAESDGELNNLDHEELEYRLNKRDEFWKQKLKKEKETAFTEGFEKGKIEGLEIARNEIDGKLDVIQAAIKKGHEEWKRRTEMIEPGVLDLAFDISEAILGIPVRDQKVRSNMTEKLTPIFQKLDQSSKPIIRVSEYDFEHVKELKEEYASKLTMFLETDEKCNPGEFELDTNDETIVHKFQEMLMEFKKNLSLPTWN
ncbi:FliH/SctL family protein [Gracilimonas sp. Q87]|uniref:FliH/SctL family protein n=1 Tax=Gracilimonas sp. Q87 TaxID=3384766 RepID=UPI0039842FCB